MEKKTNSSNKKRTNSTRKSVNRSKVSSKEERTKKTRIQNIKKEKMVDTKKPEKIKKEKKEKKSTKKEKKARRSLKQFLKDNIKKALYLILAVIAIVLIAFAFYKSFYTYRINNLFAQNAEKIQEDIENPIFRIEKILFYSAANVEDLSEDSNLANINVSQFTDFAIYIDNMSTIEELTEENTVNKLYVDNISVTGIEIGEQKVYYKDVNYICQYKRILQGTSVIDYTVLHTNAEKEETTEANVFYTDCSEPFIMTYVNENIVQNADLSNSEEIISLDGSILNHLGIDLEELNYKISFTINIENNLGDLYQCNCSLKINLDSDDGGLYTGYIMQIYDLSEENFTFRKQS